MVCLRQSRYSNPRQLRRQSRDRNSPRRYRDEVETETMLDELSELVDSLESLSERRRKC